ncbi:MAG: site-specific integrase [Erysipelotrichia bacterium]|nr:site-specific integrase [Erysipelotrichia bacterium]
MGNLVPKTKQEVSSIFEKAREYISNSKSDNTKRAYRADWKDFEQWCLTHGYFPLPAQSQTICLYLTDLAATKKVSTLQRRVAAIGQAHLAAGYTSPTTHISVRSIMSGIRREFGSMQIGKAPLLIEHIRRMINSLSASKAGVRDKAILLLGFSGAFRRSELIHLDVENISFEKEGLIVTLNRSKTDQEGKGQKKGIPYGNFGDTCPVLGLQEWLTVSGITSGAIFRSIDRHGNVSNKRLSGKAVSLVIKRIAKEVGLDPKKFAGHSLRAGLATQASISGATEIEIMNQTGHRSINTLRRYIRDGNLFRQNAAGKVGL